MKNKLRTTVLNQHCTSFPILGPIKSVCRIFLEDGAKSAFSDFKVNLKTYLTVQIYRPHTITFTLAKHWIKV